MRLGLLASVLLVPAFAFAQDPVLVRIRAAQAQLVSAEQRRERARTEPSPNRDARVALAQQAVDAIEQTLATLERAFGHEILAWTDRPAWTADERTRVTQAVAALPLDEAQRTARRGGTWGAVLQEGAALERASGRGVLAGAGRQGDEDCTLFALANAAGLPYGVVAARAAELLREATWRPEAERRDIARVVAEDGFTTAEVVLLAEAFGSAEVTRPDAFAAHLVEGRPVVVGVPPAHAVVLTSAFTHEGETWYEVLDSNRAPGNRAFVRAHDLEPLLLLNGIAFRRDPGTTPALLRPSGAAGERP